ncbi:MAG: hypothetical protein NZ853_00020 [Leptospiraceae bacterium]|nr:hypothetical protein [Leptospiraceae bacterium]MDW7976386.1 hypothetical protein [Leptospiraceae bacterium]
MINEDNRDIFENKFNYLKKKEFDIDDLYKKVFGGKGAFGIYEIKNAAGEFGLKIAENNYFGVINIGSTSKFKEQIEEKGMKVFQDAISGSLFDSIKKENSSINILIGSKKFIEGWDTWRVSSMGLLNIGKEQGTQIIQLFGRGVRLKGKDMSLTRSNLKNNIKLLETLNIYSINADYLKIFLDTINKEEVEFVTIKIPIEFQHEEKWEELYILTKRKDKSFVDEEIIELKLDDKINFTIDLLPKISAYSSKERKKGGIEQEYIKAKSEEKLTLKDKVDLLNWEKIWEEIYNFKSIRGYWNLILRKEILKKLLLSDKYKIQVLPEMLEIKTQNDLMRIEEMALLVIKKYIDLYYRKHAKRFETENIQYKKGVEQLELFVFEKSEGKYYYNLQINKKQGDLIKQIKELAENLNELTKNENKSLPRIYFNRHLYLPILLQDKKIGNISPTGLVESEKEFILGLRNYLENNKNNLLDKEIYLLKNYPFSGIGFQLDWSGFYPDFIMWILDNRTKIQRIVFIDPKGLEHEKDLDHEKIKFKDVLKDIENKLGRKDITLDSYILSITPYINLVKGKTDPKKQIEYEEHHVLFLNDNDWQRKLFERIGIKENKLTQKDRLII